MLSTFSRTSSEAFAAAAAGYSCVRGFDRMIPATHAGTSVGQKWNQPTEDT